MVSWVSKHISQDQKELNNFACWAYDTVTALAMSIEEISIVNMSFNKT